MNGRVKKPVQLKTDWVAIVGLLKGEEVWFVEQNHDGDDIHMRMNKDEVSCSLDEAIESLRANWDLE